MQIVIAVILVFIVVRLGQIANALGTIVEGLRAIRADIAKGGSGA